MKIAYIILAHKNSSQLVRLVQQLMTNDSSFFIHIDKKTSQCFAHDTKKALDKFANVFFLNRVNCYWGGFGLVDATLQGIRKLIDEKHDFDRLILLSGQDYPIKPVYQLEGFLQDNSAREFIVCEDYNIPPNKKVFSSGTDRVHYWHFSIGKIRFVFPGNLECNVANRSRIEKYQAFKLLSIVWNTLMKFFSITRPVSSELKYVIGSQFWCLTSDCVKYIHEFIDKNPKIVDFFKYTDIPDELFFQTIVMNSPFHKHIANENLHFIDWKNPNPSVPRTFVVSDFNQLIGSSKFFARKFDLYKDEKILNLLDKYLDIKSK